MNGYMMLVQWINFNLHDYIGKSQFFKLNKYKSDMYGNCFDVIGKADVYNVM